MSDLFDAYQQLTQETGHIVKIVADLVWVEGLPNVTVGEVVILENEVSGRVLTAEEKQVTVMLFGSELDVHQGMKVVRTGHPVQIAVDDGVLGHTINSLGERPYQRHDDDLELRPVEISPLGLKHRTESTRPLDTGIGVIDLMVPLAKGQRELVIGDPKTGKTHFVKQTILTQAQEGAICIYAGIGRKQSEIRSLQNFIEKNKLSEQTVMVVSELGDSPGEIFMTPYTAMTVAEYFRDQGKDVVLILDNMTMHAEYYREIALLAQAFPGKEAYPGDIFYIHSRLFERAGSFKLNDKEVSITCLPIADTTESDLSGYIQTNLMSMTDGHLFFDLDIFLSGRQPAVNLLLSVTRVGRQTQTTLEHQIGNALLELMGEFQQAQGYLRFGAELSGKLNETLQRGKLFELIFSQMGDQTMPRPLATTLAGLLWADQMPLVEYQKIIEQYHQDKKLRNTLVETIEQTQDLQVLVTLLIEIFNVKSKALPAEKPLKPVAQPNPAINPAPANTSQTQGAKQ